MEKRLVAIRYREGYVMSAILETLVVFKFAEEEAPILDTFQEEVATAAEAKSLHRRSTATREAVA